MKSPKFTRWFGLHKNEPKRTPSVVGMYQIFEYHNTALLWSWWDGKRWGFTSPDKDYAFANRKKASHWQAKIWRGLKKEWKK